MSDFFNEAYTRAQSRFTAQQWLALPPHQVTEAIYQAMREIDAATANRAATQVRGKSPKATHADQRTGV
jgi:hypothetical protein